jgi:hypothetical protein
MLSITIGKERYKLPQSYREMTYNQYLSLCKDKDSNLMSRLAILLNTTIETLEGATMEKETEKKILASLNWFNNLPDFDKIELPDYIFLEGKKCRVPKDIDYETFGQRHYAQEIIMKYEKEGYLLIDLLPKLCAIYFEPIWSDKPFEIKRVQNFESIIKESSFLDIYKIGSFFLRIYSESYQRGTSVSKMLKNKKQGKQKPRSNFFRWQGGKF